MDKAMFRISCLPDLSLAKYETLSDTGVEGVLERHGAFLRQWNRICFLNNVSMHLLFTFTPTLEAGRRLELFLALQGELDNLEAVSHVLPHSPLSDYYRFERVTDELFLHRYESCATLIKKERTVLVTRGESVSEQYYFVPEWTVNGKARMYDLCRMLTAIGTSSSCGVASAYRIDLFPVDVSQETQQAFKPPLTALRKLNGYSSDRVSLSQNSLKSDKDETAQDIINQLEGWLKKIETTPHFRVNIYGFSDSLVHARMMLGAVGADAMEQGDYTLLKIGDENNTFTVSSRMEPWPRDYCTSDSSYCNLQPFSSWSTTFTCEEVLPFFRLPALFEGETIELPKETAPPLNSTGMLVAKDANGFDVKYCIEDLTKHAMISGVPGAGKTNTMLHLVSLLWRENKIPFLVFEPAKKEYRALFNDSEMSDVLLFSPKLATKFPLRINPFEFPVGMVLSEHISTLMYVFGGSFELLGATYYFLDKAIEKSYVNLGWEPDTINHKILPYPTIEDVYRLLGDEINASDYDGEIRGNLKSFLQVRLGGLMKRDAGQIFNTARSSLAPEEWIYTPAIIELESLGEQEKNFLILLLCSLIMESLRTNPNVDLDKKVRHAIFIEEAHNIIANTTQQSSSEFINPKISATSFIVKMLAEVRALREAIVITDQLPSALAPEVMKNTSLKVVHRLTAQDDREQICATMSAGGTQIEALATYRNGEALLFYEKLQKPFKAKVCQWNYAGVPQGDRAAERYIPKNSEDLFTYLTQQQRFACILAEDNFHEVSSFIGRNIVPFTDEYFALVSEKEHLDIIIAKSTADTTTPGIEGSRKRLHTQRLLLSERIDAMYSGAERLLMRFDKLISSVICDIEPFQFFKIMLQDILSARDRIGDIRE